MPLEVLRSAALPDTLSSVAQFGDELPHAFVVGLECRVRRNDPRLQNVHYQPQQSVLNPQDEHRQTACIRYISAPQRSHSILSLSVGGVVLSGVIGRTGGRVGGSDMAAIIAYA